MAFVTARKKTVRMTDLIPLLLFIIILVVFSISVKNIQHSNQAEQTDLLFNALTRSITECYALEGAYPPDLDYLTKHYGLTYEKDAYFIDYQYIGSNLRPEVTVLRRD